MRIDDKLTKEELVELIRRKLDMLEGFGRGVDNTWVESIVTSIRETLNKLHGKRSPHKDNINSETLDY